MGSIQEAGNAGKPAALLAPRATVPVPAAPRGPATDRYVAPQAQEVARAAASHIATPLRPGNEVRLYVDGKEAYPELDRLIDTARNRLDLEFFSIYPDKGGAEMVDRLVAAAQRGVEVNVLLDDVAGRSLHNEALLDRLRAGGVRVRTFTNGYRHPLLHAFQITDHRKMILADGQTAMLGGMNLGISYAQYWHDFMVQFRGPSLTDAYQKFERNWELSGGPGLRRQEVSAAPQGTMVTQLATTSPSKHEIKDSLLAAFAAAQSTIRINSPYFVDQDVIDGLKAAARRGVAVTVILPTVGDSPVIDYMNRMATNDLLAAGVKVHAFDTTNPDHPVHDHVTDFFNHGKVAMVDDEWVSIGSANADTRSMNANQEINLVIHSAQFASEVRQRIFEHDLATRAKPAAPTHFPWYSWPKRQALSLLRPFVFAF